MWKVGSEFPHGRCFRLTFLIRSDHAKTAAPDAPRNAPDATRLWVGGRCVSQLRLANGDRRPLWRCRRLLSREVRSERRMQAGQPGTGRQEQSAQCLQSRLWLRAPPILRTALWLASADGSDALDALGRSSNTVILPQSQRTVATTPTYLTTSRS
jgi:hypothetical protein